MKKAARIIKKTFWIFYLAVIHIIAAMFIYREFATPYFTFQEVKIEAVRDKAAEKSEEVPTPLPIPSFTATPDLPELSDNFDQYNSAVSVSNTTLMIPVAGVKRDQLQDTYTQARSENRVHNAIDIIAPVGTPVVAASDGQIARFFDSERGGTTIYQFSPDKHFVYYYAHLQKRADNLQEHAFVKQGTVIGYVGDTGNAGAGNYHLHFEIMIPEDLDNYWKGADINPYPLLKNGIEAH